MTEDHTPDIILNTTNSHINMRHVDGCITNEKKNVFKNGSKYQTCFISSDWM